MYLTVCLLLQREIEMWVFFPADRVLVFLSLFGVSFVDLLREARRVDLFAISL